jgi:Mg2+ and Co2+ transporter CorA
MVAASESQFLNMLHVLLDKEYTIFNDPHKMQESFDNLKYQKEILNDHVQHLETTLLTIRKRGSKTWPTPTNPELLAIAEDAALLLHEDFSELLERAKRLARECAQGVEDVRNAASLEEAKKGINQARVVGRLTMLASIFVPLSFTTSLFGMNVRELGGDVSIWVWLAISLPLFLAAVVFCLCNKLNFWVLRRRCAQRDLAEEGLIPTE